MTIQTGDKVTVGKGKTVWTVVSVYHDGKVAVLTSDKQRITSYTHKLTKIS